MSWYPLIIPICCIQTFFTDCRYFVTLVYLRFESDVRLEQSHGNRFLKQVKVIHWTAWVTCTTFVFRIILYTYGSPPCRSFVFCYNQPRASNLRPKVATWEILSNGCCVIMKVIAIEEACLRPKKSESSYVIGLRLRYWHSRTCRSSFFLGGGYLKRPFKLHGLSGVESEFCYE